MRCILLPIRNHFPAYPQCNFRYLLFKQCSATVDCGTVQLSVRGNLPSGLLEDSSLCHESTLSVFGDVIVPALLVVYFQLASASITHAMFDAPVEPIRLVCAKNIVIPRYLLPVKHRSAGLLAGNYSMKPAMLPDGLKFKNGLSGQHRNFGQGGKPWICRLSRSSHGQQVTH